MNQEDPIKSAIISLIRQAQETNEYGGGETEDGALTAGYVDWDELRDKITRLLKQL